MKYLYLLACIIAILLSGCIATHVEMVRDLRKCELNYLKAKAKIEAQEIKIQNMSSSDSLKNIDTLRKQRYIDLILER